MIFEQGRIVRDIELKSDKSGNHHCDFTIAVKKGKDKTIFLDCSAHYKTAEHIDRYFGRGKPIIVFGDLTIEEWTDKEGKKQRKPKVQVSSFEFPLSNSEKLYDVPLADNEDEFTDASSEDLPF